MVLLAEMFEGMALAFSEVFVFVFQRWSLAVIQAGVEWHNLSSLQPLPLGSSDSSASTSRVAGTTSACPHT